MNTNNLEPITPCRHMTVLLSSLVDGNLPSLLRWYAQWHSEKCNNCGLALRALYELRNRLRALTASDELPALLPERRQAMEQAWAQLEKQQARE